MSGSATRSAPIFLSYRRDDSAFVVGHLTDRLEAVFGRDHLFRDLDDIPLGADFHQVVRNALASCSAALVVIGPDWVGRSPDGARRIDDPDDLVRIEVETALGRGIPVIPVLVGADVELDDLGLPESLAGLRDRNATRLRQAPDFDADVERIAAALDGHVRAAAPDARTADIQLSTLRSRLLQADRTELRRLAFEAKALRTRHPDHAGVLEFEDAVERARVADARAAVPAKAPRVSARRLAPWLIGGVVLAAIAIVWISAAVLTWGGDDPPPTTPAPTTTLPPPVCDQLSVEIRGIAEIEGVLGGQRLEVALAVRNDGSIDVAMPGSTSVSFVDSTGARVATLLPTGARTGWFGGFDLAAGLREETTLEIEGEWRVSGVELARIVVSDVHPVRNPFLTCTLDVDL